MGLRKWFNKTPARELMVRDVVALSPDMSLAEAAEVLVRNEIGGAPVVNEDGVCVGVLTSTDFADSRLYDATFSHGFRKASVEGA